MSESPRPSCFGGELRNECMACTFGIECEIEERKRKMPPKWCAWCTCEGPTEAEQKHWPCPLFNNEMLCEICCEYDKRAVNLQTHRLEIGEKTDKTDEQVKQTCKDCPHSRPRTTASRRSG